MSLAGVVMSEEVDPLSGAWKSDKGLTISYIKSNRNTPPKTLEVYEKVLGKMLITFERGRVVTEFGGSVFDGKYTIEKVENNAVHVKYDNEPEVLVWVVVDHNTLYLKVDNELLTREYFTRVQ